MLCFDVVPHSSDTCVCYILEVDIEGIEFTPTEMDSSGSASDAEDSLQGNSSDNGYTCPYRLNARLL